MSPVKPRIHPPCTVCGHVLDQDRNGRWRDRAGHCRCQVGNMPPHKPAEGRQP